MRCLSSLAFCSLLAWGPQQTPPPQGVAVRQVGIGFHATCELPNLPLRQGEPRRPPYVGRIESWMPFQITLENLGPSVEGSLVLRDAFITGGLDIVFRKRVALPANARKTLRFPIFHRGGQAPRILSLETDRGDTILLDGARSLEVPPPHTAGTASFLILMATESRGNFSHFLGAVREDRLPQNRYLLPVLPAELPASGLEYQGFDALALDDIPLDSLTSDQQDAIRQFVARGGTLLVSLFRSADRIRKSRLAELLPALPDEVQNVSDVGGLRAATGYPCPLDPPVAMTTFRPGPDMHGWGGAAPTLVHRRYESGAVIVCGFPLSSRFLETWPGSPRLLEMLTDSRAAEPTPIAGAIQTSPLRAEIALSLKESLIRSIPPFRAVVWILVGYGTVILIPPYLLFRRMNRLEWSWAAVFLFSLLGAGVVYRIGQSYLRKDSTAYRVGLIDGGTEDGPHLRHNFWSLFTARADHLDLSFEEPCATPYPFGRDLKLRGAKGDEGMTIGYDEIRLADFRTYAQDSSLFETTDRTVLPARLSAAAREEAGARAVRIRTDGAFPIRRAWIVGGEDMSEVTAFPDRETVVPFPNSTIERALEHLRTPGDPLPAKVAEVLLRHAKARSQATRRPVLLYLYDGTPSLKSAAIPEKGLDFGILDVEDAGTAPAEDHWQFRRLAGSGQEGFTEGALYTAEGIVFSLALRNLPDACRVTDIRFTGAQGFTLELFDQRTRSWKTVKGETPVDAQGLIHESPLGCAYALLRTRVVSGSENTRTYTYYGTPTLTTLDAVSRIERKPK